MAPNWGEGKWWQRLLAFFSPFFSSSALFSFSIFLLVERDGAKSEIGSVFFLSQQPDVTSHSASTFPTKSIMTNLGKIFISVVMLHFCQNGQLISPHFPSFF
eukprot:Lithocolla_globosa_v1_NODE_895_length_3120_cov_46.944535.p2 type:complete len:102 gc:universal NODE_895_length_3120_cov_46.944535:2246-2551(+)